MPNAFAYVMLVIWPLVGWQLFRRLGAERGLIWTLLAGYLLLPPVAKIDLPAVPDFDKYSIPNLTAAAALTFQLRHRLSFRPPGLIGWGLAAMFVLGPVGTVMTNTDPIPFRLGAIPPMRVYDIFSVIANQVIWLLPLFLARQFLATPQGQRALVEALCVAGLAYSLPMLVESQISPQLNIWVYGFFQHDFLQTIRYGGYRPVVFLPHGLWVALFAFMALMAGVILLRLTPAQRRPRALAISGWLGAMVLVCKSAGALGYALVLAPLALLARPRLQLLVAAALAVLVMAYPLLRGLHLVPLDRVMAVSEQLSPQRAESLGFRVENEEILLARAEERPVFGWGGFSRNFTHDPETGETRNIADGAWIIILGMFGWVGYLSTFGLTALPLWLLGREALLSRAAALTPLAGGLALILGASLVDLLPNATQVPLTWLIAGCLLGEAERLRALRRAESAAARAARNHPRPNRTVI